MREVLTELLSEHRAIETALERGLELRELLVGHYRKEDPVLEAVCAPAMWEKLRGQHAEALEIAARLEEARAAEHERDIDYLRRRLAAIVQHNIIEEERDVFSQHR